MRLSNRISSWVCRRNYFKCLTRRFDTSSSSLHAELNATNLIELRFMIQPHGSKQAAFPQPLSMNLMSVVYCYIMERKVQPIAVVPILMKIDRWAYRMRIRNMHPNPHFIKHEKFFQTICLTGIIFKRKSTCNTWSFMQALLLLNTRTIFLI